MTGFMLAFIVYYTRIGYVPTLVPGVYATEQACIEAGEQHGWPNAKDNPPMINGRPNPNVPNRMFKCVPAG